jgi:hypothetical protein
MFWPKTTRVIVWRAYPQSEVTIEKKITADNKNY